MKLTKKLAPLAVAAVLATPAAMIAAPAQAELSGDITVSNMYLWRGQNVSPDGGAVSGTLSYTAESGVYGGLWTSSEQGGHETDLFVGYAGEAGGLGYDISFWEYMYPEDGTLDDGISDTDASEVVLGLSYGAFSFGAYIQTDSDLNKDNYFTVGYEMGAVSFTYGMWALEDSTAGDEYSHITVGYAATDELSFAVNVTMSDDGSTQEDPLFQVSYTKGFDL